VILGFTDTHRIHMLLIVEENSMFASS